MMRQRGKTMKKTSTLFPQNEFLLKDDLHEGG